MLNISMYQGETWRSEFYDDDGGIDFSTINFVGSIGRQDAPLLSIVFNHLQNGHVEMVIEGTQSAGLSVGTYYGEIFTESDGEYTKFEDVKLQIANPVTQLNPTYQQQLNTILTWIGQASQTQIADLAAWTANN